jgi:hypothetical protein
MKTVKVRLEVWTPIIVALIMALGGVLPCLLSNDAKQQAVNDNEAKVLQLEKDKAYLAGELAALRLRLTERAPRHSARRSGSRESLAPTPEPPSLGGETIRALAEADSASLGERVQPKRTLLRQVFTPKRRAGTRKE